MIRAYLICTERGKYNTFAIRSHIRSIKEVFDICEFFWHANIQSWATMPAHFGSIVQRLGGAANWAGGSKPYQ